MSDQDPRFDNLTRRDFLKASSVVAAALGLKASGLMDAAEALALETSQGGVPVVWLQAQSCTGCSVSLLNSIRETTIDDLLINSLDLNYHPTLMAAAGSTAVAAAEAAYNQGGYVLVVEGSVPTGANGRYCTLWSGMTAEQGVARYASRAAFIVAVGTCAAYGGIPAAAPNPTLSHGLADYYGGKRVIKIPGCPIHPDWVVGTIAYLLTYGAAPALDNSGRPTQFFGKKLHGDWCPFEEAHKVTTLGQEGCLRGVGCHGPDAYCDCHQRKWNGGAPNANGVNWCCGAGYPCIGCTQPNFPDGMSPFLRKVAVNDD